MNTDYDSKIVLSDDDVPPPADWNPDMDMGKWNDAKEYRLKIGRHKGKTLGEMIATRRTRTYLEYLLKWDDLRPFTRKGIETSLAHYQQIKKAATKRDASPVRPKKAKKPRKRSRSRDSDKSGASAENVDKSE